MPGKHITNEQVKLYMSNRKHHSQATAAAKSGISERSARRIESLQHQTIKGPRHYRTRKDPLCGAFESHLIPLLTSDPKIQPITLLDYLNAQFPHKFGQHHLRTIQRRVKKWLVTEGPEQEVIFRQQHFPADLGISDYTWMNKLEITINGEAFKHKLYHYRLTFSGWTYAQVIFGGESFESLSSGMQNAFWRSGGVPKNHRTDSLSAAFNNHHEQTVLTERYDKLCKHYNVIPTRNNPGIAHENGAIESPNGHLKRKIDQQLRLRGSRDFKTMTDYQSFIDNIVVKINRQAKSRFDEERLSLQALPKHRTTDFFEKYLKVSSSSTINIRCIVYTVPSRLIGETLLAHIFDDRIELFHGSTSTLTLERIFATEGRRARSVDYRHVITSLAKKPNAFRHSKLRDDIIPSGDFSLLWKQLTINGVSDDDCHYMVSLLALSAKYDCEEQLGRYVLNAVDAGEKASIEQCRQLFGPEYIEQPEISTYQHSVDSYNECIGDMYV